MPAMAQDQSTEDGVGKLKARFSWCRAAARAWQ
jgi:hypothetical protein